MGMNHTARDAGNAAILKLWDALEWIEDELAKTTVFAVIVYLSEIGR